MHDQQQGLEFFWNGYFDDVEKSCDSHHSQWRSADAWRGHSLCQRIGYFLDNESPRGHASSFIVRKAFRWTRILWRVDQRSKPHLIKNRCTTNDFARNLRWITNNYMYKSSTATFFQNHLSLKITLRPEGKMPLPSPDVKFQGWWCLRKCFTFCRRTHLLHAHFLRTARSLRTSHTSHACHIHAWLTGL